MEYENDMPEWDGKVTKLVHGVYEIYWKSGGSSLAAVGYDREGNNWMAPVNWTSGSTTDWRDVVAYKLILANDYGRKTKNVKSPHLKIVI